jgi:hypothetical protein
MLYSKVIKVNQVFRAPSCWPPTKNTQWVETCGQLHKWSGTRGGTVCDIRLRKDCLVGPKCRRRCGSRQEDAQPASLSTQETHTPLSSFYTGVSVVFSMVWKAGIHLSTVKAWFLLPSCLPPSSHPSIPASLLVIYRWFIMSFQPLGVRCH